MPKWDDKSLGTMKRAALWLVQVVEEGNTFTKDDLRRDFPGVAQIDRRMRDLRDFGWKIDTYREDVTLQSNEQRFTRRGDAVWEPGKATRERATAISATQRYEIFMQDGHKCRRCGITPGEVHPGTDITAQLDVARRPVRTPDGTTVMQLVIECNRCRVGSRQAVVDLRNLMTRVAKLPAIEKKMLAEWIDKDARTFSTVEEVWAEYRTLPAEGRSTVRDALR